MTMTPEEIYDIINSTALMLRGMTFDPGIAQHAKEVMQAKIQELEEALKKLEETL